MLIRDLSKESRKKLSVFFDENSDINDEEENGAASWGWFSFTPLMYAAYQGDVDLAQELISKNVDINKKDDFVKFTALMWAARAGRHKVVELLLNSGADPTYSTLTWEKKRVNAYILSKEHKRSCCSVFGFWQKTQKVLGWADYDITCNLLKTHAKSV